MMKQFIVILKYMCDVSGIYETFPETLLFHRTDLKSAIDGKFSQKSSHHRKNHLQASYGQCNELSYGKRRNRNCFRV